MCKLKIPVFMQNRTFIYLTIYTILILKSKCDPHWKLSSTIYQVVEFIVWFLCCVRINQFWSYICITIYFLLQTHHYNTSPSCYDSQSIFNFLYSHNSMQKTLSMLSLQQQAIHKWFFRFSSCYLLILSMLIDTFYSYIILHYKLLFNAKFAFIKLNLMLLLSTLYGWIYLYLQLQINTVSINTIFSINKIKIYNIVYKMNTEIILKERRTYARRAFL